MTTSGIAPAGQSGGMRRGSALWLSIAVGAVCAASGCGDDDSSDGMGPTGGRAQGGSSTAQGGRGNGGGGASESGGGTAGASEPGGGAGAIGGAGVGAVAGSGAEGGNSEAGSAQGGAAAQAGATAAAGGGGQAGAGELEFDGKQIFRHETFGDEQFWTEQLRLHEAIEAALDPTTALALGLKVDAERLPPGILDTADLTSPETTVALLKLGAVVGVEGSVDDAGRLVSVGVTCALCHSTVDDSAAPGIGVRVDGAANRDLDPGAIIALAPALQNSPEALEVLNSWGPGYYDARWNQDGINAPVLIPPIYGLEDVALETYTGDGEISYWNAYVAVTQMGGLGRFSDPRIDVDVARTPDLVTPRLPALLDYQLSLKPPAADLSMLELDAVARGQALFETDARCSTCHSGPAFTDVAERLHDPEETGMDPVAAERSASKQYRTTPLRALARHAPYFHDGSAATLEDVVTHYDSILELDLSDSEKTDLAEYLKTL